MQPQVGSAVMVQVKARLSSVTFVIDSVSYTYGALKRHSWLNPSSKILLSQLFASSYLLLSDLIIFTANLTHLCVQKHD